MPPWFVVAHFPLCSRLPLRVEQPMPPWFVVARFPPWPLLWRQSWQAAGFL
jgi:hypothetical protein